MSENYKDVEFDFFSEESNFKTMIEVTSKVQEIRKRVIKEFWNALRGEMANAFQEWIIEFDNTNGDASKHSLRMYKKDWTLHDSKPKIAIAIQGLNFTDKPFIGVCKYEGISNDTFVSDNTISETAEQGLTMYGQERNNWWFSIKYLPIDLVSDTSLLPILPKNRKQELDYIIGECNQLVEILKL